MPIKYKNEKTKRKFRNNTYCCIYCGKPITPKVSKRNYCLECSIKYSEQIRKEKKETEEMLNVK